MAWTQFPNVLKQLRVADLLWEESIGAQKSIIYIRFLAGFLLATVPSQRVAQELRAKPQIAQLAPNQPEPRATNRFAEQGEETASVVVGDVARVKTVKAEGCRLWQ